MDNVYVTNERFELKDAILIKFRNKNTIIIGNDVYYNKKKINHMANLFSILLQHSDATNHRKFKIFNND